MKSSKIGFSMEFFTVGCLKTHWSISTISATGTTFSTEFILGMKVQNSVFLKDTIFRYFLQLSCLNNQFEERVEFSKY